MKWGVHTTTLTIIARNNKNCLNSKTYQLNCLLSRSRNTSLIPDTGHGQELNSSSRIWSQARSYVMLVRKFVFGFIGISFSEAFIICLFRIFDIQLSVTRDQTKGS